MRAKKTLSRGGTYLRVLVPALIVTAVFAVATLLVTLAQAGQARLFRWESVEIICSGNYAGTTVPFTGGYTLPALDAQQRRANHIKASRACGLGLAGCLPAVGLSGLFQSGGE